MSATSTSRIFGKQKRFEKTHGSVDFMSFEGDFKNTLMMNNRAVKGTLAKDIEVFHQMVSSKSWSSKYEALDKAESIVTKYKVMLTKEYEEMVATIIKLTEDKHFKVVAKANEVVASLFQKLPLKSLKPH